MSGTLELALSVIRTEAVHLAKRAWEIDMELAGNNQQITELVKVNEAAPLLDVKGFATVTAVTCLTMWFH